MGNITLWLQIGLWLLKIVYGVLTKKVTTKDVQKVTERADKQVDLLTIANDPKTSITPQVVYNTLDDHTEEINDIINSASFKQDKTPDNKPDSWIYEKYGEQKGKQK